MERSIGALRVRKSAVAQETCMLERDKAAIYINKPQQVLTKTRVEFDQPKSPRIKSVRDPHCVMQQHQLPQHQPAQPQQQPSDTLTSQTIRVMRLRDDPVPATSTPTSQPTQSSAQQQPTPPPATTTATRKTRKRKAPPTTATAPPQQQHLPLPPPPGMHLGQILLPPHALVPPGMPPHIYQYAPPEYTQPPPPPPHSQGDQQQAINSDHSGESSPKTGPGGRQLCQSKRAEQNRKAQRAFRERRDQ